MNARRPCAERDLTTEVSSDTTCRRVLTPPRIHRISRLVRVDTTGCHPSRLGAGRYLLRRPRVSPYGLHYLVQIGTEVCPVEFADRGF